MFIRHISIDGIRLKYCDANFLKDTNIISFLGGFSSNLSTRCPGFHFTISKQWISLVFTARGATSVWLWIVQSDPTDVDKFREYKWKRSNLAIPTTIAVWYVPINYPESCGNFRGENLDSRFSDESCSGRTWFLCEWWLETKCWLV